MPTAKSVNTDSIPSSDLNITVAVFPEQFNITECIFSETVNLECFSRHTGYKNVLQWMKYSEEMWYW
jgi:hypothetical protein